MRSTVIFLLAAAVPFFSAGCSDNATSPVLPTGTSAPSATSTPLPSAIPGRAATLESARQSLRDGNYEVAAAEFLSVAGRSTDPAEKSAALVGGAVAQH
ncbi:MAG TPA: hypothetical protein VFK32_05100, partial [Tepidiformaceae bacterium]|nr:hypothetical protein [Tepidiformaceae bacterium]